jgi:hypothetical protein
MGGRRRPRNWSTPRVVVRVKAKLMYGLYEGTEAISRMRSVSSILVVVFRVEIVRVTMRCVCVRLTPVCCSVEKPGL